MDMSSNSQCIVETLQLLLCNRREKDCGEFRRQQFISLAAIPWAYPAHTNPTPLEFYSLEEETWIWDAGKVVDSFNGPKDIIWGSLKIWTQCHDVILGYIPVLTHAIPIWKLFSKLDLSEMLSTGVPHQRCCQWDLLSDAAPKEPTLRFSWHQDGFKPLGCLIGEVPSSSRFSLEVEGSTPLINKGLFQGWHYLLEHLGIHRKLGVMSITRLAKDNLQPLTFRWLQ